MKDHLNSNGLVNGKIPAGNICPFIKECNHFDETVCPHGFRLKKVAFSCAAARLFSINS